ncbi:MAG: putative lipase/esterase [Candidatus Binatia bacterium]|nr:MAG: putative lipase/esterase [Candidatus Binatia bacterium]
MPLDPTAKAILDQIAPPGAPPLHSLSPQEAREAFRALRALQPSTPVEVESHDRTIPGPGGSIPVRLYRPDRSGRLPALVYFHGGGWVIGDLESHDNVCRALSKGARCLVVSVDYRLAPENPFPAAVDDAFAATKWVHANAAEIGADPERLAVGGDSAGGNLAAVVALRARDEGGPPLRFQLLVYPVTDSRFDWPSYRENGEGYLLTLDAMRWFWSLYVPDEKQRTHPFVAPLRAPDHRNLPPAHVITAEFDPLRDEGEAYAEKLRAAGVPATVHRFAGMFHGFFSMDAVLPAAREAIAEAARALEKAWSP